MVLIKIKAGENKLESWQIEAKPIKTQVLVLWVKKKDNGMFHRNLTCVFAICSSVKEMSGKLVYLWEGDNL